MASDFDPGALLACSFALSRGPRVRLRLLRSRDRAAVQDLCARTGAVLSEWELARLIRINPRTHVGLGATALLAGREALVGFGSIALDEEPPLSPAAIRVDHELTDGLDELLRQALVGRARALVRARAA